MTKLEELKANLHMTIMERQKLFEELIQMRETHETVTFELAELQQEHDSLKTEKEQLQGQLTEWENLMEMVGLLTDIYKILLGITKALSFN